MTTLTDLNLSEVFDLGVTFLDECAEMGNNNKDNDNPDRPQLVLEVFDLGVPFLDECAEIDNNSNKDNNNNNQERTVNRRQR